MINIFRRAPNKLDFDALKRGRGSIVRNLIAVALPISSLLFAIVYLRWRSVWASGLVAMSLFGASAASNLRFFRMVTRRKNLKDDADAVEVFEVETPCVLEIGHLGSHGPALCFFTGAGRALLLVGQWISSYDSFPSESFKLLRWSDTGKPIRIEVTGRPIDAVQSAAQLKPSHRFTDIQVINATPETLQADLDRALNNRPV